MTFFVLYSDFTSKVSLMRLGHAIDVSRDWPHVHVRLIIFSERGGLSFEKHFGLSDQQNNILPLTKNVLNRQQNSYYGITYIKIRIKTFNIWCIGYIENGQIHFSGLVDLLKTCLNWDSEFKNRQSSSQLRSI